MIKVKKHYKSPELTVVTFKMERGFASSSVDATTAFELGNSWVNENHDAWDGSLPSGGGNRFGGWTDNGNSAWE